MAHHASEPESGREQVRAADAVGNRFAIDWVHGVQQGCCQRKRPAAERTPRNTGTREGGRQREGL